MAIKAGQLIRLPLHYLPNKPHAYQYLNTVRRIFWAARAERQREIVITAAGDELSGNCLAAPICSTSAKIRQSAYCSRPDNHPWIFGHPGIRPVGKPQSRARQGDAGRIKRNRRDEFGDREKSGTVRSLIAGRCRGDETSRGIKIESGATAACSIRPRCYSERHGIDFCTRQEWNRRHRFTNTHTARRQLRGK